MKGIYVLVISVSKNMKTWIGSLGEIDFRKGLYAYVGSAQNNLERRIARHLSNTKKRFWHIDYLLENRSAKVLDAFHKKGRKNEECETAEDLAKSSSLIPGFGCSDCTCRSHLFRLEDREDVSRLGMEISHGIIGEHVGRVNRG